MNRLTSLIILICAIFTGCRTIPTPVPVQELTEAHEAAQEAALAAKTVTTQMEELSDALEGLPVPPSVKESARVLVESARSAEAASIVTVGKIEAVAPAVEKIAGERDRAQEAKDEAERLTAKLFIASLLLALLVGFLIMLLLRRFLPG